jgi:hypothetical protein
MKRLISFLIVFLIFFAFTVSLVYAQVDVSNPRSSRSIETQVYGVGLAGGWISGTGFSFREHLPGRLSYQVTGGIIKVGDKLTYNVGVEPQYDLVIGETSRLFALLGLGYYYSGTSSNNDLSAPFRFGLGAGVEWNVSGGFHVTTACGVVYFSDGIILPVPQVGAHYYFL